MVRNSFFFTTSNFFSKFSQGILFTFIIVGGGIIALFQSEEPRMDDGMQS